MISTSGWAVAQTYGNQERRAVENLRRQEYDAFCPMMERRGTGSACHRVVEVPTFPCYVFVLLPPGRPWGSINGTTGVIRLLTNRSAEHPIPLFVPDDKVERAVRALRESERCPFTAGTVVRVRSLADSAAAALRDLEGTVVRMDRHQRVIVLMQLLSRDVEVTFDAVDLEAVA